jgi:hypothetical protein
MEGSVVVRLRFLIRRRLRVSIGARLYACNFVPGLEFLRPVGPTAKRDQSFICRIRPPERPSRKVEFG